MKRSLTLVASAIVGAGAASAQDLSVEIEIPRINAAEYHRPYVAVWIARPDHSVAANLAVWYLMEDTAEGHGETWLKDMRQWWRRTGRQLDMPVDGVSSATRAPGRHTVQIKADDARLKALEPGEYVLNVEVSREVGGLERVTRPFKWAEGVAEQHSTSGSSELGEVALRLGGSS